MLTVEQVRLAKLIIESDRTRVPGQELRPVMGLLMALDNEERTLLMAARVRPAPPAPTQPAAPPEQPAAAPPQDQPAEKVPDQGKAE